jgi:hypothetical protein
MLTHASISTYPAYSTNPFIRLTRDHLSLLTPDPSEHFKRTKSSAPIAQVGSYVPAQAAELGIFDAIYTRMGAHDSMATVA